MGSLPVERAGDLGYKGLARHLATKQRADRYGATSRGRIRRADYTGARVGPGLTTAGTPVDDLEAALDALLQQNADQYDATNGRIDAALALLRATLAPTVLPLSASVVAYTTIGAPDVELINGVVQLTGAIAPNGSWTAGSVYPVGGLPAGFPGPRRQINRRGVTNSPDSSIRIFANPSGSIQLVAPSSTPAWVDLSSLSWVPAVTS